MRRTFTALTALATAAALVGCSPDTEEENGGGSAETTTEDAGQPGDADDSTGTAGADLDDPVCQEFYAGPNPLADRAGEQRDRIEAGEVTDSITLSEVGLLAGRLDSLARDADADQAALLERVNAPFQEAGTAVAESDQDRLGDDIELPEIDVTDSQAAQDEFEASCTD
jgi:hypothetical protein